MPSVAKKILDIVLPKKKPNERGISSTSTYTEGGTGSLSAPAYRDHLTDLFESRQSYDSRDLMKVLFRQDPDVSAAVNAYLTVANTEPVFLVYNAESKLDKAGYPLLQQLLTGLTSRTDYTLGFQLKQSFRTYCANLRYMLLLRGAIAGELVLDKTYVPIEIRLLDMASVEWNEKQAGQYKPQQKVAGRNEPINLDVATVFISFFRRDPTNIYTDSHFVSAINTIAARQQVINDLYRIMKVTGFPRIDLTIMEEVLLKNAPADVKSSRSTQNQWVKERLTEVANTFSSIRADLPFAHTDATEVSIMNAEKPGATLDITEVINTLNAQNQAALKAVSTVLGRGESGVNTASVEARVFAMNADDLNDPLEEFWSEILTLAMRLNGWDGRVEVQFMNAELREKMELEPQLNMRQARLQSDLSLGLITDEEYHLQMHHRIAPDGLPVLSGTGFEAKQMDTSNVSPNSDPLGRSLAPKDSKSAKSNSMKKGTSTSK